VTDHKTGKVRAKPGVIVGGGEVLQPVLYGMAVEQALGRPVTASRLSYCTAAGNFTERSVAVDETARRHGLEVLEIVDRAIELGILPPAPKERVCAWCDFRPVCGPWEHRRIARKPAAPLADLEKLREMP
jgi:CRISPR/Cas system-associated exonuclease Cas4 (RecB family)